MEEQSMVPSEEDGSSEDVKSALGVESKERDAQSSTGQDDGDLQEETLSPETCETININLSNVVENSRNEGDEELNEILDSYPDLEQGEVDINDILRDLDENVDGAMGEVSVATENPDNEECNGIVNELFENTCEYTEGNSSVNNVPSVPINNNKDKVESYNSDDEINTNIDTLRTVSRDGKRKNTTERTTDNIHKQISDENLSDRSISDENSSASDNVDNFVVSFPNGASYDLRNAECHNAVVCLTKSLMKTLNEKNVALEMSAKQLDDKDNKVSHLNERIKKIELENKDFGKRIHELLQELEKTKHQLQLHDSSARNAIARLQKESSEQFKALQTKCANIRKEKETAVVNYACREKEVMDSKRAAEISEKKSRDALREREKVIAQMKGMKIDLAKLKSAAEKKESEATQVKREMEKFKEDTNSQVIKVKWAQNKLKSETDAHSETREKLAKALIEIKHAKEETEQIRKNCQGMIKTYQESEEMKSNSLDSQLKEKEMLLIQQEARGSELEGIQKQKSEELRRLKERLKAVMQENNVMKMRVDCLEKERIKNEEIIKGYSETLNRQKRDASIASEKLKSADIVKEELQTTKDKIERLQGCIREQQDAEKQLSMNEEHWKVKEQELLDFTSRITVKNATLTSECEKLSSNLETERKDLLKSKELAEYLQNELTSVKTETKKQFDEMNTTKLDLEKRLEDKETLVNQLTFQFEEVRDEIRTLRRKNNASIKDLTRQLQHARRKLEPYESNTLPNGSSPTADDGSMGSRASSDTSLDCIGKNPTSSNGVTFSHNSAVESGSISGNSMNGSADQVPETMVTSSGEISKQALIERIVRLQRIHARKNEKIDFLNDHIGQLIDEVQRKNRIIQHYILREESGMLMPENALSQNTEQSVKMSRHLSMEINRKMQSVLEDTLMKNIALKESIDSLGKEIARLSNPSSLYRS